MLARLMQRWEQVRTSLWFLPALMVAGAVLLAWLAMQIRLEIDASSPVWWLNQGSAEEAGSLLSALLSSLITMATLVVSITMVVLTLAAAQLGPRLIRSFAGDWRTQAVLGLFIGTIVYILLIYRMLDSDLDRSAVPHAAITLSSLLVFVCLVTLLFYIHHLSRSIVADAVVQRVGADLDNAILRATRPSDAAADGRAEVPSSAPAALGLDRSGYVQTIDYPGIVSAAREHDAFVRLLVRPGHLVIRDRRHFEVWPPEKADPIHTRLLSAVVVGGERTASQDVEFAIRQLVEIALRALSPGINDPYTANAVIDRLGISIAGGSDRTPPQEVWEDEDGVVRLVAAVSDFRGIVDLSFDQIRQAASGNTAVLIRLADVLGVLLEAPLDDERRRIFLGHLEKVLETGRGSIRVAADLAALERRCNAAQAGVR